MLSADPSQRRENSHNDHLTLDVDAAHRSLSNSTMQASHNSNSASTSANLDANSSTNNKVSADGAQLHGSFGKGDASKPSNNNLNVGALGIPRGSLNLGNDLVVSDISPTSVASNGKQHPSHNGSVNLQGSESHSSFSPRGNMSGTFVQSPSSSSYHDRVGTPQTVKERLAQTRQRVVNIASPSPRNMPPRGTTSGGFGAPVANNGGFLVPGVFQPPGANPLSSANLHRRESVTSQSSGDDDVFASPTTTHLYDHNGVMFDRRSSDAFTESVYSSEGEQSRNGDDDDDDATAAAKQKKHRKQRRRSSVEAKSAVEACCSGICVRPFAKRSKALQQNSLFFLSGSNPIRLFLYNTIHSKPFEYFIIMCVFANCIQLAFDEPSRQGDDRPFAMYVFDMIFLAAFALEMVLKIIALGFIGHPGAYLRSGWNRLDFLIVVLSFLDLNGSFGKYTALRTMRVLRPLRSMNAVPQLKAIVVAMMTSFRSLVNVLMLCFFIFCIFGIMAVQLWSGNFRMRCRHIETQVVLEDRFCRADTGSWGELIGRECDAGYECIDYGNPNYGYTSFDNVLWAFLVIVQCITLEGWALIMYSTMDHSGWYTAAYFVLLVLIGSYFLLNLALAVISFEFGAAKSEQLEKEKMQAQLEARSKSFLLARQSMSEVVKLPFSAARWRRGIASFELPTLEEEMALARSGADGGKHSRSNSGLNDSLKDDETSKDKQEYINPFRSKARDKGGMLGVGPEDKPSDADKKDDGDDAKYKTQFLDANMAAAAAAVAAAEKKRSAHASPASSPKASDNTSPLDSNHTSSASPTSNELTAGPPPPMALRSPAAMNMNSPILSDFVNPFDQMEQKEKQLMSSPHNEAFVSGGDASQSDNDGPSRGPRSRRSSSVGIRRRRAKSMIGDFSDQQQKAEEEAKRKEELALAEKQRKTRYRPFPGSDEPFIEKINWIVAAIRYWCFRITEGPPTGTLKIRVRTTLFAKFVAGAIFANTIVLASEHHGQSDLQTDIAEGLNIFFTAVFALELVLRLIALSIRGYLSDIANVFDGFITIVSIVELFFLGGSGGISVLRTFRLLRVFRLTRRFPGLRQVVEVCVVAVKETLFLNVIILLYLLIAALTGMQLFGGKLPPSEESGLRSNFNNFMWSFYTVFQILTRDSWPDMMWLSMKVTNEAASLFYVVCVFAGDFVILNLFLAVLMSSWQKHDDYHSQMLAEDAEEIEVEGDAHAMEVEYRRQQREKEAEDEQLETIAYSNPHVELWETIGRSGGNQWTKHLKELQNMPPGETDEQKQSIRRTSLEGSASRPGTSSILKRSPGNSRRESESFMAASLSRRQSNFIFLSSEVTKKDEECPPDNSPTTQKLLDARKQQHHNRRNSHNSQDSGKEFCTRCAGEIQPALPSPFPDVVNTDADVHNRICDRVAYYEERVRVCDDLLQEYGYRIGAELMRAIAKEEETQLFLAKRQTSTTSTGTKAPSSDNNGSFTIAGLDHSAGWGGDAAANPAKFETTKNYMAAAMPEHPGTAESIGSSQETSSPKTCKPMVPTSINVSGVVEKNTSGEQSSHGTQKPDDDTHSMISSEDSGELGQPFRAFGGTAAATSGGGGGGWTVDAPTPASIEDAFEKAHSRGLLKNVKWTDYQHHTDWSFFHYLLHDEREVLSWHPGCDQIGGALVCYTSANKPPECYTTGGYSLFIFGPDNAFRVLLTNIVTHPYFDRFILFCILVSSIILAIDNPRNPQSWTKRTSNAFTTVFFIECSMKIIAFGFYFNKHAYLKSGWNVVDFSIVVLSGTTDILDAMNLDLPLSSLKVIRTFRALRPLLMINHNRGLKIIVTSIVKSIPGIINVAIVGIIVYLVFAIVGVQFYKGALYSCNDESIHARVNCTGQFLDTASDENATIVMKDREWENAEFHFDTIHYSFLALFHMATLDNWGATMYDVIDSTDPDHGPVHDNAPYRGIFCVIFIIFGTFFFLNMFIGVIVYNFGIAKDRLDGLNGFVTEEQRRWIDAERMMLNLKPTRQASRSKNNIRASCFDLAEHPLFEAAVTVAIFLNILFIAIEHYKQPDAITTMTFVTNIIFTFIFVVEAAVKIIGFGRDYFYSGGNRFDFFIVIISCIDIILDGIIPINVSILRVFRVFRIIRIMSLIKRATNLRILLETLWYSLPSLANIGAFLILIFFIYAVVGVQIFSQTKRRDAVDHHRNFESFGTAFLFLIQVTTLDNWGETMTSLMRVDDCGVETNEHDWDDCGTPFAPVYFCTFILMASFVAVNMFISIILENFETTVTLNRSNVKMADLTRFVEVWTQFDPHATLLMKTRHFPKLLSQLQPPLGVTRATGRIELLQQAAKYDIPEHGGVIHFIETMVPLARCIQCVDFSHAELREHERRWRNEHPAINDLVVLRYRNKRASVDQYLAATYIAAAYKRRMAGRYADELREKRKRTIRDYVLKNPSSAVGCKVPPPQALGITGSGFPPLPLAPVSHVAGDGVYQHRNSNTVGSTHSGPTSGGAGTTVIADVNEVSTVTTSAGAQSAQSTSL